MMKLRNKGFTITELIIVIAVIAILAAVLIPAFTGIIDKANQSAAMQKVAVAYKEALANALADDGVVADGDTATASGFTFTFSNNGANATVTAPAGFGYEPITVVNGKIFLTGSNPPAPGEDDEDEPVVPSPTTYTVTKPATVTGAGSVTAGETYTATVQSDVPFNIVVTMGGQVVSGAYTETNMTSGTVTVANVSGNIEIIVAEATNHADPSAASWYADTRLSGSGKVETSAPGWTLTNYFALQNGDTVYVKNFNLNTNSTYCSAYYSGTNGKPDCLATFVLPYGEETLKCLKDLTFGDEWTHFTVTYSGVAYMRLCGQLTGAKEDLNIIVKREGKWIAPDIVVEEGEPTQPAAPKVLYAIGDSITNGSGDKSADRWTIKGGWLEHVVTEENGFDTVNSKNLGISGLGFVHGDHNYGLTARDVIEKTDALKVAGSDPAANKINVYATFGDYDLANADIITVALGVNDWKDAAVTIDAYFAEMEYCLTKIRELNPTCKIYYILPFNTSVTGTYDTNYAFGKAGDSNATLCYSKTLGEFRDMIRASLETGALKDLNIEVIDIEGLSRDDLQKYKNGDKEMTGDGLHPSEAGYEKIGNELAALIK